MFTAQQQNIIDQAIEIIESAYHREDLTVTSPEIAAQYCRLNIGTLPYEVFSVLFLDNSHQLIAFEEMFRGTINASAVYPREVVRRVLDHNAAALVLVHNHPSGLTEPSMQDRRLTKQLVDFLAIIDVKVLDHIIVSPVSSYSFSQHGLL